MDIYVCVPMFEKGILVNYHVYYTQCIYIYIYMYIYIYICIYIYIYVYIYIYIYIYIYNVVLYCLIQWFPTFFVMTLFLIIPILKSLHDPMNILFFYY